MSDRPNNNAAQLVQQVKTLQQEVCQLRMAAAGKILRTSTGNAGGAVLLARVTAAREYVGYYDCTFGPLSQATAEEGDDLATGDFPTATVGILEQMLDVVTGVFTLKAGDPIMAIRTGKTIVDGEDKLPVFIAVMGRAGIQRIRVNMTSGQLQGTFSPAPRDDDDWFDMIEVDEC